jgi:hypothetical protein
MNLININGTMVWATLAEQATINVLQATRAGGCASVKGYVPSSNWTKKPVQDIQFISRVSTERLYKRRMNALMDIEFSDVVESIKQDKKLAALGDDKLIDVFNARKEFEINSITKTLTGVRNDPHRQGHDRCYIKISDGIKVNLKTETGDDGLKHPVLRNGHPLVGAILVSAFFLKTVTVKEGVRHVPDSGYPVRMSNAIKRVLNKTGLNIKMLSLKPDNFDKLTIDKNVIVSEELHGIVQPA